MASEPFEISSRRKISLLLYSECTIRSRIWTTSAWKLKLSCSVCALTAGTLDQMKGRRKPEGCTRPVRSAPSLSRTGWVLAWPDATDVPAGLPMGSGTPGTPDGGGKHRNGHVVPRACPADGVP